MSSGPADLISVIVPVYNAERYLDGCVSSILAQTYTHLELILVDDGSTDSSPARCDGYAARDPRVRVIHQENGGIGRAQNTGLDAARGAFIAFADNDDLLHHQNLELLHRALVETDASMSKGRWRQMGVSGLADTRRAAAGAVEGSGAVTVIDDALHAYQSVFCKTLRLAGTALGRPTEARYFNEANWCRLYRRELWEGLRFPEGRYAQDICMAGPLYARMERVADVDAVLYYWLQAPSSVTHSKRDPGFWHDNVTAAAQNFTFTLDHGVLPCRNYFGLTASTRDEGRGLAGMGDAATSEHWARYEEDRATTARLIGRLKPVQRMRCWALATIRRLENKVYDRKIHDMR